MTSQRQSLVESEVEAMRLAEWLQDKVPQLTPFGNILDAFDSEPGQQFLEQYGDAFARQLMDVGARLDHDPAAFAHGVSFGLILGDYLKNGRCLPPPINLIGPIESGET